MIVHIMIENIKEKQKGKDNYKMFTLLKKLSQTKLCEILRKKCFIRLKKNIILILGNKNMTHNI